MKWTEELIKEHLLKSIEILNLERMPTADELKNIGRNDLHCKISRTKKYSGWANELGLSLKKCTTRTGSEYEERMERFLTNKGYDVELTSTKHPYDLFINGSVKVDVKVSSILHDVWTFHLAKEQPTCDIYIFIALNDDKSTNRIFVVPSHNVKMKSVSIGKNSKYDVYKENYDLINKYSRFHNSIK